MEAVYVFRILLFLGFVTENGTENTKTTIQTLKHILPNSIEVLVLYNCSSFQ